MPHFVNYMFWLFLLKKLNDTWLNRQAEPIFLRWKIVSFINVWMLGQQQFWWRVLQRQELGGCRTESLSEISHRWKHKNTWCNTWTLKRISGSCTIKFMIKSWTNEKKKQGNDIFSNFSYLFTTWIPPFMVHKVILYSIARHSPPETSAGAISHIAKQKMLLAQLTWMSCLIFVIKHYGFGNNLRQGFFLFVFVVFFLIWQRQQGEIHPGSPQQLKEQKKMFFGVGRLHIY